MTPDPLVEFFAPCRHCKLTSAERAETWQALGSAKTPVRSAGIDRRMSMMQHVLKVFGCAQNCCLTPAERSACRERVFSHMAANPVHIARKGWNRFLPPLWVLRTVPTLVVSVAVVSATTLGFVAAAEESIPGDLLYPVKVRFTEPVAAFLVHADRRDLFELERMDRRLIEAERLAMIADHDENARTLLSRHMEEQEQYARKLLEETHSFDNLERAAAFREQLIAVLDSHASFVAAMAMTDTNDVNMVAFAGRMGSVQQRMEAIARQADSAGVVIAQATTVAQNVARIAEDIERVRRMQHAPQRTDDLRENVRQMDRELAAAKHALEAGNLALAEDLVRAGRRRVRAVAQVPPTAVAKTDDNATTTMMLTDGEEVASAALHSGTGGTATGSSASED